MKSSKFLWPEGEDLVFVRPPDEFYDGKLDFFYDAGLFPELKELKQNWKAIRDEILEFEQNAGRLEGMSSVNPANVVGGNWTLIYLKSFMRVYNKNLERFPLIRSLINDIPNCVFSAISILPPNTKIEPHYGDTNGIIRVHLGLIVPFPYPEIAIRVGDQERGWEEGEFMCFVNVHKHNVWNNTNSKRYVLMLDIVPEPLKERQLEISLLGLASQTYNYFYLKSALFRKLPVFIHQAFISIAKFIWRIYLPIETKFKLN